MDPNFVPYKTGNVLVKEKYPCGGGCGKSKGRRLVYYLCEFELCHKEFILSGDEVSRHPYSRGCTPRPEKEEYPEPAKLDKDTKALLTSRRRISSNNTSGIPGVSYNKQQDRWVVRFFFHNIKIHVGTFRTKEEALKARIDIEKKYYPDDEDIKEKKGK